MSAAALALVALGGLLGAPARFALDGAVTSWRARRARGAPPAPAVPPGTLMANLLGALLLGVLAGAAPPGPAPLWLAAAGTGFCGAFTTFSTATLEAVRLAQAARWGAAALTAAVHLIGSLAALGLGLAVGAALG